MANDTELKRPSGPFPAFNAGAPQASMRDKTLLVSAE